MILTVLAASRFATYVNSFHAATNLIHHLICSRVDFGDTIFAGLSLANILKVQSAVNATDHLIG